MPTVDFETHIVSKFVCPKPSDAGPGERRSHQLAPLHDSRAPHCVVDLVVGTRGTFVTRTDANGYEGHVPDAPVLLGASQQLAYAKGAKNCGASWARHRALACAAAVGASFGFAFGTALTGALAVSHLLLPAHVGPIGFGLWLYLGLAMAGVLATALVAGDLRDWRGAAAKFTALDRMASAANELNLARTTPRTVADSRALADAFWDSPAWELQQAAYELRALADRADAKGLKTAA